MRSSDRANGSITKKSSAPTTSPPTLSGRAIAAVQPAALQILQIIHNETVAVAPRLADQPVCFCVGCADGYAMKFVIYRTRFEIELEIFTLTVNRPVRAVRPREAGANSFERASRRLALVPRTCGGTSHVHDYASVRLRFEDFGFELVYFLSLAQCSRASVGLTSVRLGGAIAVLRWRRRRYSKFVKVDSGRHTTYLGLWASA